jgi:hypothetical protein
VRARVNAQSEIDVLKFPHGVLRPGSQDEVMVVTPEGRLEARHVVYAVAKDGSLLVRRGLLPSDRLLAAPKPEAKSGDLVSVESATKVAP